MWGLVQCTNGEGVGWCTANSEVSTNSNGVNPLHSGGPSEFSLGSDSAGKGVGQAGCWS